MKKKVALVAGFCEHQRSLLMFGDLAIDSDVTVFMFRSRKETHLPDYFTYVQFETSELTPGYMKGLEEHLRGFDLIITFEHTSLAAFQCYKSVRKYGQPLFIYSTDYLPYYYENCKNIKTIRNEVMQAVKRYFVPAQACAAVLATDQVEASLVSLTPPTVDTQEFCFSPGLRQRFRKEVGLAETDVVILYKGDLDLRENPLIAVEALQLLNQLKTRGWENVKVLFAGSGKDDRNLKEVCYQSGIGNSFYFLAQETGRFFRDLLCASDFLLCTKSTNLDKLQVFPYELLEAMACGVVPLVFPGTIQAELAGECGLAIVDGSYKGMAAALQNALRGENLESSKRKVVERIQANFAHQPGQSPIGQALRDFLCRIRGAKADFNRIEALRRSGDKSEVLREVSELLQTWDAKDSERSELLCVRGEALADLNDLDQAVVSFEAALDLHPLNGAAFRGLGYIALTSHAHEEATIFFKKALSHSLNDSRSLFGMGIVCKRLELFEDALFWLEKALLTGDTDSNVVWELAQVCESANPKLAVKTLEEIIENIGESPNLLVCLGKLYIKTGEIEKGKRLLADYFATEDQSSVHK